MARKSENYLDYVPVISGKHSWEVRDGVVTVHMVHRGVFPWIAQTFFSRPRVSHIRLDAYGSYIFQRIDGTRSVGELAELMREQFGREAEPLYERLVKYMQILKNNGFIDYAKKGGR